MFKITLKSVSLINLKTPEIKINLLLQNEVFQNLITLVTLMILNVVILLHILLHHIFMFLMKQVNYIYKNAFKN